MDSSCNPIDHDFQQVYHAYVENTDLSSELIHRTMDESFIRRIRLQDDASSMSVWLFVQFYNRWIDPSQGTVDDLFFPPIALQNLIVDLLLDMLLGIESGHFDVEPVYDPHNTVAEIPYRVSNGWIVAIYSRSYAWHRIDSFTTPQGIAFDPWLLTEEELHDRIFDYSPPEDVQKRIYGFKNVS